MIGLRPHERDPSLLERAGERSLRVPGEEQLLASVARHLVRPGTAAPIGARLEYARWKPGVSLCTTHQVEFADGARALVTSRSYAGGKAEALRAALPGPEGDARLAPCADAGSGTFLYAFPCDRMLPGAARLLERKRTARLLNALPLDAGARVRWRRLGVELLRYRPERRAVFRLEVALSDPDERWSAARVAARVLPPALVPSLLAARGACFAGERAGLAPGPGAGCDAADAERALAPGLLGAEPRTGIVFERWLEVEVGRPDDFRDGELAGALLARLHGDPAAAAVRPPSAVDDLALFAVDPELAGAARDLALRLASRAAPCEPTVWIHGDCHPDQIARVAGGNSGRLLDLDLLRRGAASEDLASWVADHLAHEPAIDARTALEPLLEGYRAHGGRAPAPRALALSISEALFARAAATLRRLERGAPAKAAELIARARGLADGREESA